MHFLIFILVIFGHRCHQISSIPLCGELTEFVDNIFKFPLFKLMLNFFEILKANMAKNPERVMTR